MIYLVVLLFGLRAFFDNSNARLVWFALLSVFLPRFAFVMLFGGLYLFQGCTSSHCLLFFLVWPFCVFYLFCSLLFSIFIGAVPFFLFLVGPQPETKVWCKFIFIFLFLLFHLRICFNQKQKKIRYEGNKLPTVDNSDI